LKLFDFWKIENYSCRPAITFRSRAEDQQVPANNGQRLALALAKTQARCESEWKWFHTRQQVTVFMKACGIIV